MCTINMTFEVPESKHINIEALKKQMHSYLEFILSMPNIEEKVEEKKYDMSFFDRFDNDWSDDPRDSHEIAAELHDSRVNDRPEMGVWDQRDRSGR